MSTIAITRASELDGIFQVEKPRVNTLEARIALDVDAILAEAKKPRHRKIRFPRTSRKPVAVEEWWA